MALTVHAWLELADRRCRNGYSLNDLPSLIDKSAIDEKGLIHPEDFNMPITNLFIGINTESEGCEGCILLTLNSLMEKQKASPLRIKLNIYIVDGGETDSANIYRELRAYDPDLDGSEAPAYKGI
jgi:hypothetical protein